MTSLGLMAFKCSHPSPQPSRQPGLKFSMTTSTSLTSLRTTSCASACRRSSVIDFLLRDCTCHHTEVPSWISRHLRKGSPLTGGSTLMRSEEHTSELQSLMRISYAVFCLKKKNNPDITNTVKNQV